VRISALLNAPTVRVLLFLLVQEVRHADLAELVRSRGTLSLSLKELERDGLISRRVVIARPIESYYSLTVKGKKVATKFEELTYIIAE
jgi:DNA-binding HxlR family transcriptional regulator